MPSNYLRDWKSKQTTIVITVILASSESLSGGVEELYILPHDEYRYFQVLPNNCYSVDSVMPLRVPWNMLIDPRWDLQVRLDYFNLPMISNPQHLSDLSANIPWNDGGLVEAGPKTMEMVHFRVNMYLGSLGPHPWQWASLGMVRRFNVRMHQDYRWSEIGNHHIL